jgi:phage baseplate assembly protein W
LLLTNKGERVFNPNFGGNLRTLFFQQIDDVTEDELITIIQDDIKFILSKCTSQRNKI